MSRNEGIERLLLALLQIDEISGTTFHTPDTMFLFHSSELLSMHFLNDGEAVSRSLATSRQLLSCSPLMCG